MKLNYIDSLRGIAILSVIWFHCHLNHYSNPAYFSFMDTLGSPAAMGVQLFYVLSAFTLFLSRDRRNRSDNKDINFFFRRFFRIAPLYYVAIIYYLCQMAYAYNESLSSTIASNRFGIIANIALLHGLSPSWINSITPGGWSVGIEVLFYIMIPYLFARITNLNRAVLFTAWTLLFGFILTSILSQVEFVQSNQLLSRYLFFCLPFQLPVFGCGIVAYYIVIKKDYYVRWFVVGLAVSVLVLIILSKTIGKQFVPNLPHTLHLFGSIGFVLLIVVMAKQPLWLFVNGITQFIGKISYSGYLTHFGVLYWLGKVLPQDIIPVDSIFTNIVNFQLKFLIVVLLTTIISTVTYRFIEEPAQQFGKRFIKVSSKNLPALSLPNV